jgi:hypothetical protein
MSDIEELVNERTGAKELVQDGTEVEQIKESEEQKPNALLIKLDLADALMEYLKSKPMIEVERLVNALSNSRAVVLNDGPEPKE